MTAKANRPYEIVVYGSTSRMIAETGIALLSCKAEGGVATPGALLGEALVERLREHAEISFAVED